jgi:uncharacterized protein (UPF0335 family)
VELGLKAYYIAIKSRERGRKKDLKKKKEKKSMFSIYLDAPSVTSLRV